VSLKDGMLDHKGVLRIETGEVTGPECDHGSR
jgi:hypothetical protein